MAVWRSAAFLGMFGDPYLRGTPYEAGGDPQALVGALSGLSQLLQPQQQANDETDPVIFSLTVEQELVLQTTLLSQLVFCGKWAEMGAKVEDAAQFQAFLAEWKAELAKLQVGQPVLVPGGYVGNVNSHSIIYVVEKTSDAEYSFTVCNKGPGAEMYHPCKVEAGADKIRVQSSIQIGAIPATRFLDMAFWTLLFSLWVRKPPSEYHRVETIYDVLLPWLAGDKLLPLASEMTEKHTPADWTTAALGGVHTAQRSQLGFCKSVIEAVRYLCLRSRAFTNDEVEYAILYKLRYRLFQQVVKDLEIAQNPAKAIPEGTLDNALRTLSTISLQDSLQGTHTVAAIDPEAVVGIYFALSKSAACRKLTKLLTGLSESLHAAGKKFVVIVVSVDQEQADYTAFVESLPGHTWLMVPFPEMEARKQLIQTFGVTKVPQLILRRSDGTILTPMGKELVMSDPTGEFFPWTSEDFALPKSTLSVSETKCIAMGVKQIGLKTLKHHERKNIQAHGLGHVNKLMSQTEQLIEAVGVTASSEGKSKRETATLDETFTFAPHANVELLQLQGKESEYAGNASELEIPVLNNFLDVPERVTSIALAVAAFVRCETLCESLLKRAAEGSSSSRMSLHHEVIQLITSVLVEVLPVPVPISSDGTASPTCMWRQSVMKDMQLRCLNHLHSLLMILGSVWQSVEQPSRQFDSERALAALCVLSIYDAVVRTPAADEPLEISLMMEEEGGYVLAHTFCKANFSVQKLTSAMEFARPNFCVVRGQVLTYFHSQDAKGKRQLFDYHMPEDKIEVKKYSTTLLFFRQLMERYHYPLIDPNNQTPPTEMEALMEWFCSDTTPMADDHPEVGLTRDLVMVVKFLATMETKEVELMRRRTAHQHWQMWQLSFDDSSATHRRNFFGMRGLNRILHATLKWEVVNFRGSDQDIADVEVEGFMERKVYFGEGPVITSPANLSALLVKSSSNASAGSLPTVITEDDIMHLTDLPAYNGTLSAEESEYLMSYLTVPYTRIPLVVSFFSSRDRVTYLFNPMLQQLFRAVLFEGGDWVSDEKAEEISHVPLRKSNLVMHEEAIQRTFDARVHHQKCEDHLGTMNGLLLNELIHAPEAIVVPLLKMLDAVKELGEASVHSADARFILFMIKLGVDVLRYMTFALDRCIAGDDRARVENLEGYRSQLMNYTFGFAHATLNKWRKEAEDANNLQTACVIHSYLVLLHVSLRPSEYDAQKISEMIGSIAYVHNWHCFGMKLSVDSGDEKDGLSAEERLLRWLQAQGIDTANVGKKSLDKYLKGRPLYLKIGMQTIQAPSIVALRNSEGKELQLPPGDVLEAEIFETMQLHRRSIVNWFVGLPKINRNKVLGGIVRIALRSNEQTDTWEWIEESGVGGSDDKDKEKIATFKEIVAYRTMQVMHIYALVSHGRRLYRKLIFTSNSRLSLHSFPLNISPDQGPVDPALLRASGEPTERQMLGGSLIILRKNHLLNGTEQFVPPRLLQGVVPSCLLENFRFWMGEDGRLRGEPVDLKSQWFRYRVEVEMKKNGQAFISRKSIMTSFSRIYRDGQEKERAAASSQMQPPPAPVRVPGRSTAEAPRTPSYPSPTSIEISDDDVVQLMAMGFSYAGCGLALRENHNNVGLAAQWLLDENNQMKILAAEEAAASGEVALSPEEQHEQNIGLLMSLEGSPSRSAVEYALGLFGNELELAIAWLSDPANRTEIQRAEAAQSGGVSGSVEELPTPMEVDEESKDGEGDDDALEVVEETVGETLYLLSMLEACSARENDEAHTLCELLSRVEDLSHILVWCTNKDAESAPSGLSSITFIELPRLKLKLQPIKAPETGRIRLNVMDQNGWFVSDLTVAMPEGTSKYLRGLVEIAPDCFVLESDTTDLKLICPNHDLYRPAIRGEPFSSILVSDRGSVGWQQAMETRFYTYPVHSSNTFLLPSSLSSTLYLILTSLLTRNYAAAMELIMGCNVDVKFTDEEKRVFDQLAKTLDDRHPNACACRIRLSLGIAYSDNKAPWKVSGELHDYVTTSGHVDASCKLTLEEEKEALAHCHQRSSLLLLRKEFCDHVQPNTAAKIDFTLTRSRVGGQPWMKLRLYSKGYLAAHGKKLSTVRYNRPKHGVGIDNKFLIDDEEAGKLVWNCAVVGDEISGTNRGLGFLFLYECLNQQLVVRMGGDDCTRSFGDLFARFLHLKLSRWGRETVDDGEEECAPSYAMAQLAMVIAHPGSGWPSSPCDQESVQMLSRGANLYSKMTVGTMLKHFFDFGEMEFQSKLESEDHQTRIIGPVKAQFSELHHTAEHVFEIPLSPTDDSKDFDASNASCGELPFVGGKDCPINPEFPLEAIDVKRFITFCDPEAEVGTTLPFDLSNHPVAQTAAAKDLLKRLGDDIAINAKAVNGSKDAFITGVTPTDLYSPGEQTASSSAVENLQTLIRICEQMRTNDRKMVEAGIATLEMQLNEIRRDIHGNAEQVIAADRFVMQRHVGVYPRVTFDFLTSLLASDSFEADLKARNPFAVDVTADLIEKILLVLFLCSRIVHINRTVQATRALVKHLNGFVAPQSGDDWSSRVKMTRQASRDLADVLLSKRYYLHGSAQGTSSGWRFDPRFLVFEYVFDILLRGRQVQMIDSFLTSLAKGDSRVQQMIMGAGKTTVVGPLLTYILADKTHLVMHVMPTALLEQSRQVLRSRFSNRVLRKRIFTFEFDRAISDDPAAALQMFTKLDRARRHGDVVCASPESIKSMMLKLVELLHSLDESSDIIELPLTSASQNIRRLRRVLEDRSEMADELHKTLRLWQNGILIMDEVDVLLHPLRSELNFPIGNKFPIDLAANRWELPIYLIDAVLASPSDSKDLSGLIPRLHSVLDEGYAAHTLQRFPHLVLLDMGFYEARMLPLLSEIAIEWLLKLFRMGKMEVPVDRIKYYLECPRPELHTDASLRADIENGLSESSIKLLNLARDWLRTILPHVLSKINRVSYGLLRGEHQAAATSGNSGGNAHSRLMLAVPFIGKDVPSRSSEFAHPDVLIGLTILAYRYEGIRVSDLVRIVSQLKQDFSRQLGPRDQRPACAMFREWVGTGLAALSSEKQDASGGVLPLPLFQLRDSAQVARLHFLVAKLAGVVYYYVRQHVFPSCMNFQKLKISACGHELGSNSLFAKRIGFSGTPSNLLPMDLGECYYEPRSDGSIFEALTNKRIVSIERKVEWTARSLLLDIAHAQLPVHALIDTGALITGFDNQEVAAFLLGELPAEMEGVVYLDENDRQMILLRDHNAPMPLVQCGLSPSKRFTFYDQVHTTGMDIKQCVNARAVVTLGKDMTFRDYAQGAYRMRGIATGQSICLFLIPEVENRIRHEMKLAEVELNSQGSVQQRLDEFLLLVPAWLLVNSMRMESMQLVQLSLQELHNTWRRRALRSLLDEIATATSKNASLSSRLRRFIGREDDSGKAWLRKCIAIFRVEISYTVDAAVPTRKQLSDVIGNLIQSHKELLKTEEEMARVTAVQQRLAHSSGSQQQILAEDGSQQGDLRLTAEVVHENEAEAEEEAEEEAEQEEQKMSAFTRDDEHPIPWSASVLAQTPSGAAAASTRDEEMKTAAQQQQEEEASVFYPFAQFQAHSECPKIAFPQELLMSGNFFRRRWVGLGERRVKNVGLILEWSPLLHQEAMKTVVQQLFMAIMADGSGGSANEIAVKALQAAAELATTSPDTVSDAVKDAVTLTTSKMPVYLATLSLAEGETIRRMIHTKHPVFQVSQVQLRTSEGELVESSSFFSAWTPKPSPTALTEMAPRQKTIAVGVQCLRFFNNEMYYFPNELEMLLEGLATVPISLRHEVFECLLRLRRRERHLWGDTPLAKVFTAQSEWHLLTARARLQQFQQSLLRKQRQYQKKKEKGKDPKPTLAALHLAVALRRFDEDEDSRLSAEEVHKCFESFQLGFSSKELNEIIGLIADARFTDGEKGHEQGIPMETICAAFGISREAMKNALLRDDQESARAAAGLDVEASWACPVCTYVNDSGADTCGACNEPNPKHQDEDAKHQQQQQGWRCGNCTFINQPDDVCCAICDLDMDGQRGVPRGKWVCAGEQGGCTFFNSMANFYCEVCNRARPDLASTRF
ncbi:hypothetical protein JG687_00005501 [Phytophthora cactorum]|uniref:ubiquitinyl hydrolase 1 n=1 Tax=Phytophthora cactorum TaxID=29920 RepID=A0A8T1UN11_9STRA|nr:hypothetical protein JG687_00005501 [Phytophthora cactorum]